MFDQCCNSKTKIITVTLKKNILIIHGYSVFPLRATIRDLLYCYEKYLDNANCFYLNLHEVFNTPKYLLLLKWDLIVFHTTFLSGRWLGEEHFKEHIIKKALPFAKLKTIRIILPQDEWIHCNSVIKFINEIKIHHVFSVSPASEWPVIYEGVNFYEVCFHEVLTGYIDEQVLGRIGKIVSKNDSKRSIDIGYRAFRSPPWLGKAGYLKTEIAEIFQKNAPHHNLKINISTKNEDTILGDKWYEFMSDCRYFIGVEGGSTVLDPKGEIWKKGVEFMQKHPTANYEEIEKNVFPGLDPSVNFLMTSPRHLEACITKTGQVLIEGGYNGILQPEIHYIELKKDFSNLEEVLEKIKDEDYRLKMVERAYQDIACSGKYTYSQFVNDVISKSLKGKTIKLKGPLSKIIYIANKKHEAWRWKHIERLYSEEKTRKEIIINYFKYTFIPRWKGRAKKILMIK